MAKRIVVEFTCDECGRVDREISDFQPGRMIMAYPQGWHIDRLGHAGDLCPKCFQKVNDICEQVKVRSK